MESRNLVTAREMTETGCWLVPHMNGELRLEKPPLPTWVAACIETVAPNNLSAQRAAAGVMGVVMLFFFFKTVRLLTGSRRDALLAAAVLLTCYQVVMMGRTATWDIYCHAFMMGGIYFLLRGLYAERLHTVPHVWRDFPVAGLFMGLSFMSKGPVSFFALLLPMAIALPILGHPAMKNKWAPAVSGLLICLITGLWWYVYLFIAQPEAMHAMTHKESGAWSNHNVRPWWYYWRFFSETGIWALLTLAVLPVTWWRRRMENPRPYLFGTSWMIATVVALSLMPEKKIRYLFPIMIPASLAVAMLLAHLRDAFATKRIERRLFRAQGYAVATVVLAIPILVYWLLYLPGTMSTHLIVYTSILLILIAVHLFFTASQGFAGSFTGGVVAAFMVIECLLLPCIAHRLSGDTSHSIAQTQNDTRLKALPFYHIGSEPLRIELVYNVRKIVKPLPADSSLKRVLPCALITLKPVAQELSPSVLSTLDTVPVGYFDNNRHAPGTKHYNPDLKTYVTIIKQKQ